MVTQVGRHGPTANTQLKHSNKFTENSRSNKKRVLY